MKRICIILGLWGLIGLSAYAQANRPTPRAAERTPPSAEERARKMTEKLRTELDLSPEQADQAYQINLQTAQAHDEYREAQATERAEWRAQREAIESERESALLQVLDPAQRERYEGLKAERQEKRQERMENRQQRMEKKPGRARPRP